METKAIQPNNVTLIAALSGCSHAGLVDEALDLYKGIAKGHFQGVSVDTQHQNCIVDILGQAGRLQEAEQFITANMPHPDNIMWITFLGACCIHSDVVRAERIAKRLIKLKPEGAASHVLLGNIYAGAGQWDDKLCIWQAMKDDQVSKQPGLSWIMIDGQRHVFKVEDKDHPQADQIQRELSKLWECMKAAGFTPNKLVITWHKYGNDEEAKECHLRHHSKKLAIAFGILRTPAGSTLRIFKNLRVCPDCHEATKVISRITEHEIIVRDANRFHHFTVDGKCSCKDYW